MRTAIILAMVASVGCAGADARRNALTGEAALSKLLEGYAPGKQVDCITLHDADNQIVIEGTAIVYRALGGKLYVNRPDGANFLHEDDIQISKPFSGQLCRHDIIEQRDRYSHIPGGTIVLGDFTLYTRIKTAPATGQ